LPPPAHTGVKGLGVDPPGLTLNPARPPPPAHTGVKGLGVNPNPPVCAGAGGRAGGLAATLPATAVPAASVTSAAVAASTDTPSAITAAHATAAVAATTVTFAGGVPLKAGSALSW